MRWLLKFSAIIALSCLSYIAAIDSTAQIWSPPTNISRTSPLGISIFPAITIDSLGNPHAVWQAKFLPGMLGDKYEIVYSRWDGAKWLREGAAPKNISHTPGESSRPTVAIDSSENPHVVWLDDTQGNAEVFYSRWDGTSWSKPMNISNTDENSRPHGSARALIAIDSSGNPQVVWADYLSNNWEIFYSRWDGTSWSKPMNISETDSDSINPAIAIDSSGNLHVCWQERFLENLENTGILYRRQIGTVWSKLLNISNKDGGAFNPAIATDSLGTPHVVWVDSSSGSFNILYSRWNGTSWSKPMNVSNNTGIPSNPAIAVDSLGIPNLVWDDNTPGNIEILYSRWNGTSWSKPINVSKTDGDSNYPAIAVVSLGSPHVTWQEKLGAVPEILYSRGLWSLAPPPAPKLLGPADGGVLDTLAASTLTLQWDNIPDAVLYRDIQEFVYHFQIAKDEKFADIIVQSSVKEPNFIIPMSKMTDGQKYFWRVRAIGFTTGVWSQTWSFEVNAKSNLVKVFISSEDMLEATVEVRAEKMKKLYGFQMDLFFDPKMLEVLEVKEGNFLRSIGGNTFWKPPVVDNQVGAIKDIISTRLTPGEAEGEGILLVIRFRAKAKGKSVIGFTRLKLSDEQAKPIAGLPMEGTIDTSGLSTTFTAVPRIENNLVVLNIQSSKAINVEWFSLDIEYPDALELIEGKTHIEGGKIPESGIVATLKFRIWESGKMYFHLKNGITKGLLDDTGMPTLIDGNITMMVSPAWDVNKDYIVDIFDMVILGTNLDKKITGKPRPNPDVTGDGIVDLFDFVKVGANFGATYSAITGARISPIMIDQHSLAFSKQLAFQYLPLWQNLYEKLKMNPNLSEEFVKTKFLLQDLIALASSQMAPIQTKLMQNYPNPFNPETWIPYQLSESANVIIQIYDSTGRLVRILNIGRQSAGIYVSKEKAAYWDGKNEIGEAVASGVYYYFIKANGFRATRRMILLK